MNKITVGLITYNRPLLLKRALKSVLNQSYKNFEILIGNDYPDNKISFESLGIKKNKKIQIYNHKYNLGERNNMNFLLKKSNSEWFIWLADDDYFHKELFKRLIECTYNTSKKVVACYSNYSRAELVKNVEKKKYEIFNKKIFLKGFSKKKIRIIGVFGLIKTKILKKINGIHKTGKSFKINNKITHHYPYCDPLVPIMLSNYGNIIWLDQKLVFLNTDYNSVSSYTQEYEVYKSSEVYLYNKVKKAISNFNNKEKNEIKKNILEWFFFNRLNVIEKRNFSKNIFFLSKYIFDLIYLFKKNKKIISFLDMLKKIMEIFKSLIKSAYL